MAVAGAVLIALALQGGARDSVRVTGEPSLYQIFGPRELVIHHLTGPPDNRALRVVQRNDTLGVIAPLPARLSARHHYTIERARVLYGQRRFTDAAALLAPAYAEEPNNPFVANEYARALFWIDDRRDESFAVYQRLIAFLDGLYGTSDRQVAVDAWLGEAYWKIASFHLDRGEWERAAFEITRFLAVTDRSRSNAVLEQVFSYLAEAYVELGQADMARWSAQQALAINPRSRDGLRYLYALGPAARSWSATHVFACRVSADPCLGGYAFYRGAGLPGLACVTPREERATPLSPCLRIGWVHVGQRREAVEEILGPPWRPAPPRDDGTEAFAYLLFHDDSTDRGSYYLVEYERAAETRVARAVQFTGDSTPLPLDFTGLRLGDPADRLLRQLGEPETRGQFNDEAHGLRGEWWDWNSAAISVEIVAGRLYSIRLWRPDGVAPAVIERAFSRFR